MESPVLHCGSFAVVSFGQEATEGNTGHVDPLATTDNEIHGDAERILGIIFEAGTVGESKRQESRTTTIGVSPDVTAHRHKAIETSVADGRIGEHRCENRD